MTLYQHCVCGHSLYVHRDGQCEHPHHCGCTGYRECECSQSE